MLQIETQHYASDALEDAMRLAQTKSLNSYTFSDCINFLNYAWSDIYSRMAQIDDGYYGTNIRITSKLTKLPPFVKNTVQVYHAQSPVGYDRIVYRSSGTTDITASGTYKLSGNDLYVPDAERRVVWLYFVPACPQIFFTHHNRDPKLYEIETADEDVRKYFRLNRCNKYNLFTLKGYDEDSIEVTFDTETLLDNNEWVSTEVDDRLADTRNDIMRITKWTMCHRGTNKEDDITEKLVCPISDTEDGKWNIVYISCDYPYIFITYEHSITKEHVSGFFDKSMQFNEYNPFAYTGRNSDIEYISCHWNDKTGMGVIVKDYNDKYNYYADKLQDDGTLRRVYIKDYRIKELGWTPDTQLNYPVPEMYRYLVARLADKLAALNESDVMGVQAELVEAAYAFESYLSKDKSSFQRIINVNPANYGDWL